ncbi:phosphatidate cytidylyltransferase [Candidatus Saccharibacteria bacterium]|nr:phosphatidate cytidylyltransferase [Candidatus Saccharibacteria bacterium]
MDKNFKVRVSVGVFMFAVALIALYTFDSIPFKIIYSLFSIVAAVELLTFFKKKVSTLTVILAIIEIIFLILGSVFAIRTDLKHFWLVILGVPGYDIFAYLFGKLLGGRIFKKSRPFPHISKNKTWEGTILGLTTAILLVTITLFMTDSFATDYIYLLCGPLALIGDLFESFLKRRFGVKDSNEIIIKKPFFEKLELVVGGSEGHGGFLDRVDSTAFACSVLLIVLLFI